MFSLDTPVMQWDLVINPRLQIILLGLSTRPKSPRDAFYGAGREDYVLAVIYQHNTVKSRELQVSSK